MARKPKMKQGTFSRKHHIAIARIISNNGSLKGVVTEWNVGARSVHYSVARALADYFADDNDNFDRALFLSEAGVEAK